MKVFVVKHLPTGKYLPPIKSCVPATRRDLSDMPRIFYRTQDAIAAARWWAKGDAYTVYDDDWETGLREPAGVNSTPVKGRALKDLRICATSLTVLNETEQEIKPK